MVRTRRYVVCLFAVALWLTYSLPVALAGRVNKHIHKRFSFNSYEFRDRYDDINLLGSASVMSAGSIRIPVLDSEDPDSDYIDDGGSWGDQAPLMQHKTGRALYSSPVRMFDPNTSLPATFNTSFSFIINHHPSSSADDPTNRSPGGGLAFIIAPDELTVGRDAGWLGFLNEPCRETYNAFAVEFDTFKNQELDDPNDNHVAINLANLRSNHSVDGSQAGVYLRRNGSFVTAWISYDGHSRHLQIHLANRSSTERPSTPAISIPLDLSPILKEYMFVGFTAAAGSEAQTHDIVSWNYSGTTHAAPRFPSKFLKDRSLCIGNLSDAGSIKNRKKRSRESEAFLICLSVSVVLLLTFVNLAFGRSDKKQAAMKLLIKSHRPRPLHKPRKFKYQELVAATNDFSEKEKLGEGRYGGVYKGVLKDGSLVAVKRLSNLQILCCQKKLIDGIAPILGQKQPHLVPLRGWCRVKKELLLVNEYMPNGSLDKWLYPDPRTVLPWILRWKVIKSLAASLAFLHDGSNPPLLHRQVKTSNVLLDTSLVAKLGDYGIGFWIEHHQARFFAQPTSDAAFSAYQAPEASLYSNKATDKTDVYSFGVTVMELVCGRKPVDKTLAPPEAVLVEWIWELHRKNNLLAAVDKRIGTQYDSEQVLRSLTVGILCTHADSARRPTMKKAVELLSGIKPTPSPNFLSKAPQTSSGSLTDSMKDQVEDQKHIETV